MCIHVNTYGRQLQDEFNMENGNLKCMHFNSGVNLGKVYRYEIFYKMKINLVKCVIDVHFRISGTVWINGVEIKDEIIV